MKTAAELSHGEKGTIAEIDCAHPSSRRILEFGFTPGQVIELISRATFDDPIAILIRGSLIAIRKSEADCIKLK
jgi:ferrous iron transport protein A